MPKIVLKGNGPLDTKDPMVILIHVVRRYLTEILNKKNFEADIFFQRIKDKIRTLVIDSPDSKSVTAFHSFIVILKKEYSDVLKGIVNSNRMRENERKVVQLVISTSGNKKEINVILRMLNEIKNEENFRHRIDDLIKLTDLNMPTIPSIIPPEFTRYINQLFEMNGEFKAMLAHIFEKGIMSQRMAKLSTIIFLSLDDNHYKHVVKEIFPVCMAISNNEKSFTRIFANIFLAKGESENFRQHFRRVSKYLKQDLKKEDFLALFKDLPINKLKPANSPLFVIFRSLIDARPNFLHHMTHEIFVESNGNSLSRVLLELLKRGLTQIFNYSEMQSNDYIAKCIKSIVYYHSTYLPPEKKQKSHFFVMISALNKYNSDLLDHIRKKKIFRDSEIETLMPIINGIHKFKTEQNEDEALDELWKRLLTVRQNKEIRDELTEISKLTDISVAIYFKEFIPYINDLLRDPERFRLVFQHAYQQTKLDPNKFESAISWHVNLLNSIIRYLSDMAILADNNCKSVLAEVVEGWLGIDRLFIFNLYQLLEEEYFHNIENLMIYLYGNSKQTLCFITTSIVELENEAVVKKAVAMIQSIFIMLLEFIHSLNASEIDTTREIQQLEAMFNKCFDDLGESFIPKKRLMFHENFMREIKHLTQVRSSTNGTNSDNGGDNGLIPKIMVTQIHQTSRLFNLPNLKKRAITNLNEMLQWLTQSLKDEPKEDAYLLPNLSKLYGLFESKYSFPQLTKNSIYHNFSSKIDFDVFSFVYVVYAIQKKMGWGDIYVRSVWRDVSLTVDGSNEDLDLKNNTIVDSSYYLRNKSRFFKEHERLLTPMKIENAIKLFYNMTNGIALAEAKRYRLAIISLNKTLKQNNSIVFAHYWKAYALKLSKSNLKQYEHHISESDRLYPNSQEIESLKRIKTESNIR